MSTIRSQMRAALLELVARRDPTVFQNADVFEKQLLQTGKWQGTPEIAAVKAGLQERFPWELQKDPNRIVSGKVAETLATMLHKKHAIEPETALWAVETWSVALGLKFQPPQPAATSSNATHNSSPIPSTVPAFKEPDTSSTRLGVILGTDETGLIRVYKSWFDNAPQSETASMIATTIKIDPPKNIPLFSAAPKVKAKPARAASGPTSTSKARGAAGTDPNAPRMVKTLETAKSGPEPAEAPPATTCHTEPEHPADAMLSKANALLPGGKGRLDVREALGLLQLAVKQGSLKARRRFGEIYLKGIGVNPNLPNAAKWFKSAAELGDVESQFQLGSLYQCGVGVDYNLEMAQIWLQRAADQGHKGAAELLKQILQA